MSIIRGPGGACAARNACMQAAPRRPCKHPLLRSQLGLLSLCHGGRGGCRCCSCSCRWGLWRCGLDHHELGGGLRCVGEGRLSWGATLHTLQARPAATPPTWLLASSNTMRACLLGGADAAAAAPGSPAVEAGAAAAAVVVVASGAAAAAAGVGAGAAAGAALVVGPLLAASSRVTSSSLSPVRGWFRALSSSLSCCAGQGACRGRAWGRAHGAHGARAGSCGPQPARCVTSRRVAQQQQQAPTFTVSFCSSSRLAAAIDGSDAADGAWPEPVAAGGGLGWAGGLCKTKEGNTLPGVASRGARARDV